MGNRDSLDYAEYERQCEARRRENARYLAAFEGYLEAADLSQKTIDGHLDNVVFYLNTYLLREGPLPMEEGCRRADDFFGYFFIYKCMWSTPNTIKSTAGSLKKFYKCMLEHGFIEAESLRYLLETIRDNMGFWIETCKEFNDSSSDWLD